MSLEYQKSADIIIKRLESAHDIKRKHIRKDFFKAENKFFQAYIKNKKVLIAGSGLGHDTFELAKYNKEVIGIEIVEYFLDYSIDKLKELKLNNVKLKLGDFTKLSYKDKYFDAAILNMGTIGNFDDKEKVIKELLRVSKKVYLDFYKEDPTSLKIRKKMYEEEKWINVRIKGTTIKSDDGLESISIPKEEITKIVKKLKAKVKYYPILNFATMAEISP